MPKMHPVRPYLRAWRMHMNRTQEILAEQIGVAHSTVARQESGMLGVDDATFEAIARAYGITVAELSGPPKDAPRARLLSRLLEQVRRLDDQQVETLARLAEQLTPPKR